MRTLGVVLAGGRSARFGSDKALALFEGSTLLTHQLSLLETWCDGVCVAGRTTPEYASVADWPAPNLGPLGGIAAGLRHAHAHGFGEVLTVPVDMPRLPADLPARLSPAPAALADQPVVGLWPAAALDAIEAILTTDRRRSMHAFAEAVGARMVALDEPLANINTREDLRNAHAARNLLE